MIICHKQELKELEITMDTYLPSILELVEMYLPYKDVKIYENRMYRIYDTIAKIEDEITKCQKEYESNRSRK